MNVQPSKSSRANHSSNTSKIASRRAAGVSARCYTSVQSQARVQRSSRISRKASARSSFDGKLR